MMHGQKIIKILYVDNTITLPLVSEMLLALCLCFLVDDRLLSVQSNATITT